MTTVLVSLARIIPAALVTALLATGCENLPKDQTLIVRLQQDRESFDQLAHIALAELASSDSSFVFIPDSTTARRRPDALPIIKRLRTGRVYAGRGHVEIPAAGLSTFSIAIKGWEFVPEGGTPPDPGKIVPSLDGADDDLQPYDRLYRSLGEGWYLYLESTSD
jgi:hypothetical protein